MENDTLRSNLWRLCQKLRNQILVQHRNQKTRRDDDKGGNVQRTFKDFFTILQTTPQIEQGAGREHHSGNDDVGNASGIQHPKSINDAENGNQPGFEADRIMAETPVFKAGFQAIQGG